MLVTLDGQRLSDSFATDSTLGQVVDQVRSLHENCLIVSVALNGQILGEEELEPRLAERVPTDAQVDLESGQPMPLVRDALRGLAEEFAEAAGRQESIANQLAAGNAPAAVAEVGGCIGLWQTCHRVLVQCSGLLGEDLTRFTHETRTVQACFEDVVSQLIELRAALEGRDMVRLSDLVRYEMPDLCKAWRGLLDDLAQQVENAACSTT